MASTNPSPNPNPTAPPRLYFGYGSNLWRKQMSLRCPSSRFVGTGRLPGYRWMINSRGYANVAPVTPAVAVAVPEEEEESVPQQEEKEVWGLVYSLHDDDEARLDVNEGVPWAYEKRVCRGELWEVLTVVDDDDRNNNREEERRSSKGMEQGAKKKEDVDMLVYIDFERADGEGNKPREEYVHRMNMGIRDALAAGIPAGYVDGVLRGWIPEEDLEEGEEAGEEGGDDAKESVRELARRQARSFEDESGVVQRTGSGIGFSSRG